MDSTAGTRLKKQDLIRNVTEFKHISIPTLDYILKNFLLPEKKKKVITLNRSGF